jgi:hypothetical protein
MRREIIQMAPVNTTVNRKICKFLETGPPVLRNDIEKIAHIADFAYIYNYLSSC